MAVTVTVNKRTVVHKESGGKSIAMNDVCMTPMGPSSVPVPYPNLAKSADMENGAGSVKADGHPMGHAKSFFKTSTGDEAGANKGVGSGTIQGKAEFVSFSFDVNVEGQGVVRAFDRMIHNNKNTPPTPLLQQPMVVTAIPEKPVTPEQGHVAVEFLDTFGEPMVGLPVEIEIDGEKQTMSTMSRGNVVHVTEKDRVTMTIKNEMFDFKKKE